MLSASLCEQGGGRKTGWETDSFHAIPSNQGLFNTHVSFRSLHPGCLRAAERTFTDSVSIEVFVRARTSRFSCVLNTEQKSCHQRKHWSLLSGLCAREKTEHDSSSEIELEKTYL